MTDSQLRDTLKSCVNSMKSQAYIGFGSVVDLELYIKADDAIFPLFWCLEMKNNPFMIKGSTAVVDVHTLRFILMVADDIDLNNTDHLYNSDAGRSLIDEFYNEIIKKDEIYDPVIKDINDLYRTKNIVFQGRGFTLQTESTIKYCCND